MRRETALKYCREIHYRLAACSGYIETPGCDHESYKVNRVWVFGSVAKGSESPNDVDLLIDGENVGEYRQYKPDGGMKLDKRRNKAYGWSDCVSSWHDAYVWLSKGMKKVSRHDYKQERIPIDVKIEIYPNYCLEVGGTICS